MILLEKHRERSKNVRFLGRGDLGISLELMLHLKVQQIRVCVLIASTFWWETKKEHCLLGFPILRQTHMGHNQVNIFQCL